MKLTTPLAGRLVLGAAIAATIVVAATLIAPRYEAVAQGAVQFFRVATGPTAGTYFPIGGLIASAISSPPGSRSCETGGSCGVANLIAVAQTTGGSEDNLRSMAAGEVESALAQADTGWRAYNGTGLFSESEPMRGIRTIANLYPEKVHIVVRANSNIMSIPDLAGRSVSLGPQGGALVDNAHLILNAYGMSKDDIVPVYAAPGRAADALRDGELDAMFLIAGEPVTAIEDLARKSSLRLLPINPEVAAKIVEEQPFFAPSIIDGEVYPGVERTYTLSVGAQWFVTESVEEQLIYDITQALWHPRTLEMLRERHPRGRLIRLETAVDGLGTPLHPGAARFYAEQGLFLPTAKN